jgi:hypothetical protein
MMMKMEEKNLKGVTLIILMGIDDTVIFKTPGWMIG